MILIEETPKWMVEGDCSHCGLHHKAVIPENCGAYPGQEAVMPCNSCGQFFTLIVPEKPKTTLQMKP